MNLFDLNNDVGWPTKGEGESSTPLCFVSPWIVVQEKTETSNPPNVRSHLVKKSRKRQLSGSLAKDVAKDNHQIW